MSNQGLKCSQLVFFFKTVVLKCDITVNICCNQVTKSNTNPDELGGLANQLTTEFGDLASEARCAALTAESDEVSLSSVRNMS